MEKHSTHQEGAIVAVGIDVAKDTLAICLLLEDGTTIDFGIENKEADIRAFAKESLVGFAGKVVLESTGRFQLVAALTLTELGHDVRLINPLLTRKYHTSAIRKVKTDKTDARILAEIALREERLPPRFDHDKSFAYLRKKIGLLASLEKQLQQFRGVMHDFEQTRTSLSMEASTAETAIHNTVKELKRQKDQLEKEITRMGNDLCDTDAIDRFDSIPGVSPALAVIAAQYFSHMTDFLHSPKQWIAFVGMDLSIRQSGLWYGKSKLSKRGNPYIRKRLHCAAWGAVRHDARFNAYYYQLKAQGRKHTEALLIIARKLLRIMFQLTKSKSMYDPELIVFPA
jgi:transposase